jgi:hypothetical protein
MPSPSTEVPLAFSWREIRQRGAAWCTSGSLVPISGAPVGVYPRLHTLEEVGPAPAGARPRRLPKPRSTLRQASSGGTWQRARSPVRPSHHHRNEAGRAVGLEMAGRGYKERNRKRQAHADALRRTLHSGGAKDEEEPQVNPPDAASHRSSRGASGPSAARDGDTLGTATRIEGCSSPRARAA